jgi:hypothetical protein
MYSLTINPDRSATYTEMVDNVQETHHIPSEAMESILTPEMLAAIEAAFQRHLRG